MSSGQYGADLNENIGVASSTGLGDGAYQLFVAKNRSGTIVASYMSFIDLSEMK